MKSDLYRDRRNLYMNRYGVLYVEGEQLNRRDVDYNTADKPVSPLAEIIKGTSQSIAFS